jgi:2-iminobutanoate/2-iminopropanoate deaminase
MKRLWILVCVIALGGCQVEANHEPEIEWLKLPGTENMDLPFSAAVRVDNMLYLSGDIGYDRDTGKLVDGGIQPETRKTLENIQAKLEMFGSSMDRVVKCTVFLADIAEWSAMNEVYVEFFPNKPARSALGSSGLALGARTEIECIAVVG